MVAPTSNISIGMPQIPSTDNKQQLPSQPQVSSNISNCTVYGAGLLNAAVSVVKFCMLVVI